MLLRALIMSGLCSVALGIKCHNLLVLGSQMPRLQTCQADQVCAKAEMNVSVEAGFRNFTSEPTPAAACVNKTSCSSDKCAEVLQITFDANFPLFSLAKNLTISGCSLTCCDWDFCNIGSIASINEEKSLRTSTIAASTLPSSSTTQQSSPASVTTSPLGSTTTAATASTPLASSTPSTVSTEISVETSATSTQISPSTSVATSSKPDPVVTTVLTPSTTSSSCHAALHLASLLVCTLFGTIMILY